jgi:hypothetical protein
MTPRMISFLIWYRKNLPSSIDDMIRMQKQFNKERNKKNG